MTSVHDQQSIVSAIYLLITLGILSVKLVAPLNQLLNYGKTAEVKSVPESTHTIRKLINYISNKFVVPKSYFQHFYVVLVTSSLISIYSTRKCDRSTSTTAKYKNLLIIQYLLLFQGMRRLLECIFITKFSTTSKMNISHYIIGIVHYILISSSCHLGLKLYCNSSKIELTWIDYILIVLFLICSYNQYQVHSYFAKLDKYNIPDFKYVSSPHYTFEILIYTILVIFSMKDSQFDDLTGVNFLTGWLFVTTNLSISALETHKYYRQKHKQQSEKDRFYLTYCLVPGVF